MSIFNMFFYGKIQFGFIIKMEELKVSKFCSKKQGNGNQGEVLYQDYFSQLKKLHDHMGRKIQHDKQTTLSKSFNQIDTLNQSIIQLQSKIKYQPTQDQIIKQREELLIQKENLLSTIQKYSAEITLLKKEMSSLKIQHDQIKGEIDKYGNALENKKSYESLSQSLCLNNNLQVPTKLGRAIRNTELPSIHSKSRVLVKSRLMPQNDSKWAKIDQCFIKLNELKCNDLVDVLYSVAKRQNSSFKNMLKGYHINQRMSELAKDAKIKKQLKLLKNKS